MIGDNVQNNWLLEILLTENRKRKEDWAKYSQTEIPNILKNKENKTLGLFQSSNLQFDCPTKLLIKTQRCSQNSRNLYNPKYDDEFAADLPNIKISSSQFC